LVGFYALGQGAFWNTARAQGLLLLLFSNLQLKNKTNESIIQRKRNYTAWEPAADPTVRAVLSDRF
jgi:hypothetical protein